jgi:hypothetical protein
VGRDGAALSGRWRGIASYSFGRLGALTLTLRRRSKGIVDPLLSIAFPSRITESMLSAMNALEEAMRLGTPCRRPPTWYASPGITDDLGLRHHWGKSASFHHEQRFHSLP